MVYYNPQKKLGSLIPNKSPQKPVFFYIAHLHNQNFPMRFGRQVAFLSNDPRPNVQHPPKSIDVEDA